MSMAPLLLGGIFEERPHARELARGRRWTEPLPTPLGKKGAQIRGGQTDQVGRADRLCSIGAEEVNQPMRGRDIGANGVRGTAAIVLEMAGPASGKLACRMVRQVCGSVSHLRIIAATLLPRNISNSEPWRASRLNAWRCPSASRPTGKAY